MQTTPTTAPPLPDEQLRQVQLDTTKRLATGLLLLATAIFVIARILEERYPWLGYVRATAEAGMVGAIADWFAVTALFRYPLGIPIPHTAIIPHRKDRIGQSLGRFIQNNFLSREVVVAKLRSVGIAERIAAWLGDPAHRRSLSGHLSAALAGATRVLKDEEVQALIEHSLAARLRATRVTPLFADLLTLLTADRRHQEVLDAALRFVPHLLEENEEALRLRIRQESPWWVPAQVDDKIYRKMVAGVERTLQEVSADPDHPLRARFNQGVDEFVDRLKHSPEMIERGEALKEELLEHPAVRSYSASLWTDLKRALLGRNADPGSIFRRQIEEALAGFGESLRDDVELRAKVDTWVEGGVLYLVEQGRHEMADVISTTVEAWDAADTSRKIELQIGRDLQFIRINGTLVGGLAGLVIYTVSRWL